MSRFHLATAIVLALTGAGDASAQQAPFASTVYVPSDGLAFRRFDGRVIARLSYGPHGGTLDLYDEHETVKVTQGVLVKEPQPIDRNAGKVMP